MPFAMIDLEWLDGSEYHRFLLWLIPKIAGVDGFNGLEQGQLRFSRREIELEFAVGHSKATSFTEKAVCDGLLKPLKKSVCRKGMGEIFQSLGILRKTRIQPDQPADQQRTNHQADQIDTNKRLSPSTGPTSGPTADQPADRYNEETKNKTKKTIKIVPPKEGLKEILEWDGMDYSSVFWEVLKPFPADKKSYPLTIAKTFRDAIRSEGATPEILYAAAVALSKARDAQYMPDASKWMKEQGWRAYATG